MRKFPYYCLDCEAVFELERFDIGVTCCPKCGRRRIVPLGAVFPFMFVLREKGWREGKQKYALRRG